MMSARLAAHVRIAVLGLTMTLIALTVAWILEAGTSTGRLLFALGATLPLLLPLASLKRGQRRTYAAMTLCVIPYLVVALTEVIANPAARFWASAILACSFGLFVALIAYLRVSRGTTMQSDGGLP